MLDRLLCPQRWSEPEVSFDPRWKHYVIYHLGRHVTNIQTFPRILPIALSAALLLALSLLPACGGPDPDVPALSSTPREQARRHVNLGVAYLAQFLPGRATEDRKVPSVA